MTHPRRILEIDLVGTALLLEAFEPLVEPGSAAVCFSSSSAYQVALGGHRCRASGPRVRPSRPGFPRCRRRAIAGQRHRVRMGEARRHSRGRPGRGGVGPPRRAGELAGAGTDRHADGSPGGGATADHEVDAGEDAPRASRPAREVAAVVAFLLSDRGIVHFRNRPPGRRRNAAGADRRLRDQRGHAPCAGSRRLQAARRTNSANSAGWVRWATCDASSMVNVGHARVRASWGEVSTCGQLAP
jgi:hypothetical protein